MTKVLWGEPIAPEHIDLFEDDTPMRVTWSNGMSTLDCFFKWTFASHNFHKGAEDQPPSVRHFEIPADHPYYLATSEGFTYWPGGKVGPIKDGKRVVVIYRNGVEGSVYPDSARWGWTMQAYDVIGYRKRGEPTERFKNCAAIEEKPFIEPLAASDWAFQKIYRLLGSDDTYFTVENLQRSCLAQAFARYIEQHEKPPIDPDVLAVREILAAYAEKWGSDEEAEQIRGGLVDDGVGLAAALEAYRTVKVNGGVVK
jgi:hypothetical protein